MKLVTVAPAMIAASVAILALQDSRKPVSPILGDVEPIELSGGVPSGFMILAETPGSPRGYEFTGMNVLATSGVASWRNKAALPTARYGLIAITVNDKIYAIGAATIARSMRNP